MGKYGVCHHHLKQPYKNWRNPASSRDNTCQSLGLMFSCNKVLIVDPTIVEVWKMMFLSSKLCLGHMLIFRGVGEVL